jgi:hypothetical protein
VPAAVEVDDELVRTMVRRAGAGRATIVVRRTGGELSGVYEARLEDSDAAVIVKVYAPEWVWKQAKEIHVAGTPLSEVGLRARSDRTVPLDRPLPP